MLVILLVDLRQVFLAGSASSPLMVPLVLANEANMSAMESVVVYHSWNSCNIFVINIIKFIKQI